MHNKTKRVGKETKITKKVIDYKKFKLAQERQEKCIKEHKKDSSAYKKIL